MRVQSQLDIHNVTTSVEQTRRSSDKLIGLGPLGLGLDGILTWVPIVGEFYTIGAGAYLLAQGARARVSGIVLWQMTALLMVDFALGVVPIAGDTLDVLFCAHLWAGGLLLRAIKRTAYIDRNDLDGSGGAAAPAISAAMTAGHRVVILKGA